MKKAFDQTVRDLKRGVNKKVLKVPSVEQKVLDATSNEPWGPHGTLLADVAQATRNYNEYQMIMAVIWKRVNDTGKNWRHVYKALTVLEYLVAHGSERVIDEIREHSYQISTLSEFQYVDSSGRDQGSNVRKKSQSLVALVNDKERIQEVRQKAAANRENMYRPGSYSNSGGYADRYDDERIGSRDDDRNGYGREREWGRDEERYGRHSGDSYGREGERYGKDYDERFSRDGYKDDDYSGRDQSIDDYHSGSRSKSADRERDHAYDDDAQYSSSASGGGLDRKYSEQNISAPPSYEEAVGAAQSPTPIERDGETSSAHALKSPSPHSSGSPGQETTVPAPIPSAGSAPENKDISNFDEFDPRAAFAAAPPGTEMDLLGSLSDSFSSNTLALVPAASTDATSNGDPPSTAQPVNTFATSPASTVANQAFDDPFGDGPFKAIPSSNDIASQHPAPYIPSSIQSPNVPPPGSHKVEISDNFGGTHHVASYSAPNASSVPLPSSNQQYGQQELSSSNQEIDILADILPPSGQPQNEVPVPASQYAPETGIQSHQATQHSSHTEFIPHSTPALQTGFASSNGPASLHGSAQQPGPASLVTFSAQPGLQSQMSFPTSQPVQQIGLPSQTSQPVQQIGLPSQTSQSSNMTGPAGFPAQAPQTVFMAQNGQPAALAGFPPHGSSLAQPQFHASSGPQSLQPDARFYGGYNTLLGSTGRSAPPMYPQPSTAAVTPQSPQIQLNAYTAQPNPSPSISSFTASSQPAKDKFETKSSVWADTLNRGLVNLNISGSKTNPLADIGVDFDAINRKEKRMEKPTTSTLTATITMGKAMGSGSGMGRAGAGVLRPAQNPTVGIGSGLGQVNQGGGIGMGNLRVNQPVGMGMNSQISMGMGPGMPMQQPTGFPPGSYIPGNYNPTTGTHNYYGQQPYGGSGYR
ncbi:unnamed protein product [Cuscuta campestris]|uniref:ENTH domain-containing protein n=1 Tax=Cuscuta campestris TaxID=132261 RepID=A0A484KGD3_9ASTE|nr:unnamed protein product [Cuscuta campestris]